MSIISEEETSFNRTLDLGVKHLKKVVATLKANGGTEVAAKDAHLLFSTMGFPLDLTELMAAEHGFTHSPYLLTYLLIYSLTHLLTHSLTHSTHSLTHSTHSLTHSTHSLTHSLTLLTHSLTHLLTHSLTRFDR